MPCPHAPINEARPLVTHEHVTTNPELYRFTNEKPRFTLLPKRHLAVNDCYTSYGRPYGHSDTGRCSLYQVGAYATGSYLALPQSLRCLRRPLGVCGVAVGSKREFVIL